MNEKIKSVLVLIFLIGLFLTVISFNSNKDITKYCAGNTSCLISLVKETQNYSLCDLSENVTLCYNKISIIEKKPQLCKMTENRSYCYMSNAVIFKNLSLCTNTTNQGDCIFQVAANSANPSFCNYSNDSAQCYFSFAYSTKNASLCNLSGKYKQSCILKIENQSN